MLGVDCQGRDIRTIEGVSLASHENGKRKGEQKTAHPMQAELSVVQEAFMEADAFQCGYCTSGQIMSLTALLAETPAPTDADILRAVSGNLCRCGAYRNILEAGRIAAKRMSSSASGKNGHQAGGESRSESQNQAGRG
jgi:aerobic-type carbon monoxide dehydrogenase small subunit (CoxS/CutS family)